MMFLLHGNIRCSLIPLENIIKRILIRHFEDITQENINEFDAFLWTEFLTLSNASYHFIYQTKSTFNNVARQNEENKKFPKIVTSVERICRHFQQKSSISLSYLQERREQCQMFSQDFPIPMPGNCSIILIAPSTPFIHMESGKMISKKHLIYTYIIFPLCIWVICILFLNCFEHF